MFGDDVKMTVHSEWRLCVGGEGEALANPGAARPRNCSCSHQVTGKVKPARCSHTGKGQRDIVTSTGHGGGLELPNKGGQTGAALHAR